MNRKEMQYVSIFIFILLIILIIFISINKPKPFNKPNVVYYKLDNNIICKDYRDRKSVV